ncbi:hypothetical protein GO755_29755 [Spirosoma sp. HMF4905]|uniref:Uncharacterized protein n=1 Tax=Spirosoma arboris TaxID=2682092 RepID=A0A7K1SKL2_9BACT|nr:hypothetical protein [Spirosoma arboris]MVM34253.1 hypothetical protein [Spirosoma arboris]
MKITLIILIIINILVAVFLIYMGRTVEKEGTPGRLGAYTISAMFLTNAIALIIQL